MKLFISYSHVDKPLCKPIIRTLEEGHNVWYDHHIKVSENWWDRIKDRLDWCEGFVYLLSPESVASKYCKKEYAFIRDELELGKKHIFSVQLRSNTIIPKKLLDYQFINASEGWGANEATALLVGISAAEKRITSSQPPPASAHTDFDTEKPIVGPVETAMSGKEQSQSQPKIVISTDVLPPDTHTIPSEWYYHRTSEQNPVTVFKMSITAITNAQYSLFLQQNLGMPTPEHWEGNRIPLGEIADHPVTYVNFNEAEAFCLWLKMLSGDEWRLPTSIEWEAAGRNPCPDNRRFSWGDEFDPKKCNVLQSKHSITTSVFHYGEAGASPNKIWGLIGNVWEWVDTPYKPDDPDDNRNIIRGGSYQDAIGKLSLSEIGGMARDSRRPYLGFRVVSSL